MKRDTNNKMRCEICEDYFNEVNPMGYLYLVTVDRQGFDGKGLDFCTIKCLKKYVEEL